MTATMESLAHALVELGGEPVAGISPEQIREVAADQRHAALPRRYEEFLAVMGRRSGRLGIADDSGYPGILGVRERAQEILAGDGAGHLLGENTVVFATHQGYLVYWMTDAGLDDPPVRRFSEGEGIDREWPSFTACLAYYARLRGISWGDDA